MAQRIFREYPFHSGKETAALYGSAVRGDAKARVVNDSVIQVGEDAGIVLSDYDVIGVFDGAGGATDVGSPARASKTAALAVQRYFDEGGRTLEDALKHARQAVVRDPASGVCVATLAQIQTESSGARSLQVVTAGDTGAVVFDQTRMGEDATETILFHSHQQADSVGDPTNFLGRPPRGVRPRLQDKSEVYENLLPHQSVFLMTDGVLGHLGAPSELQEYHLEAAHNEYLALDELRAHPNAVSIAQDIRNAIRKNEGALKRQQRRDSENRYGEGGWNSPELDDPNSFTLAHMDWDIWYEFVKPVADQLGVAPKLSRQAILSMLIDRPIRWPHEAVRPDDATVIMVQIS